MSKNPFWGNKFVHRMGSTRHLLNKRICIWQVAAKWLPHYNKQLSLSSRWPHSHYQHCNNAKKEIFLLKKNTNFDNPNQWGGGGHGTPLADIQLPTFAYKRLLNKPYESEVTLTKQNLHLKCCQSLELLTQLKIFKCLKFEVCRSKGCKVTSYQS